MTDCTKYQELISSYIDGEISDDEKVELMEHIKTCPSCASLLKTYEALFNGAEQNFAEPPQQLVSGVMDKIRKEENAAVKAETSSGFKSSTKKRSVWIKYIAAAACIALILISVPKIIENNNLNSSAASSDTSEVADTEFDDSADADTALPPQYATKSELSAGSAEDGFSENISEETGNVGTDDAPADAAEPSNSERKDDIIYSATIYISGDLPDILSSYPQTDLGDGSFSISISEDIANSLSDMGYSIEYNGDNTAENIDYTVIYTPSQE